MFFTLTKRQNWGCWFSSLSSQQERNVSAFSGRVCCALLFAVLLTVGYQISRKRTVQHRASQTFGVFLRRLLYPQKVSGQPGSQWPWRNYNIAPLLSLQIMQGHSVQRVVGNGKTWSVLSKEKENYSLSGLMTFMAGVPYPVYKLTQLHSQNSHLRLHSMGWL